MLRHRAALAAPRKARRWGRQAGSALGLLVFLFVLPAIPADQQIRLCIVTGGHAYDGSFGCLFEEPEFAAVFYPRDVAYRRDLRAPCDVLVLYDLSVLITDTEKSNLRSFLESNKGLVVLHHAIADYNSWSWWYEEVVAGKYFLEPEGGRPASTYHPNQSVVYHSVKHPITTGIETLRLTDETYKGMWVSDRVRPLLRTDHALSDPVVAWISPYRQSRVVVVQPGHGRSTHSDAGYRRFLRNAILWAAGRLPEEDSNK